ncbi:MAG: pyruvate kinase [Magnetococcales bacterium]|nr:pyruvate kinase [Magnetococcales bacterium]
MDRRAKIIATLGPATNTEDQIASLIRNGMDVARLNMSHGTHHEHAKTIANVRNASRREGREVALLLDLQGPKIRVGHLDEPLKLKAGEQWAIVPDGSEGGWLQAFAGHIIPTTYRGLAKDVQKGQRVLFDDGTLLAHAVESNKRALIIKIAHGGVLKSHKGINLPDSQISAPSLTKKDQQDLFFGLRHGIDYVALSFVRSARCLRNVKYMLHERGLSLPVVAKIERPEAIENIEEIIAVSDVVMVARGDMAVEVGNHKVPALQRHIIRLCRREGTMVITATQMLESMIHNPVPTRAEATDVANAIWDGTDAVMLSAETSVGSYPSETVATMSQLVREAEHFPRDLPIKTSAYSISAAAMKASARLAEEVNAKWIISLTSSGNSCWEIARYRPAIPVLGVGRTIEAVRRMALYWGITPALFDLDEQSHPDLDEEALLFLQESGQIVQGDKVVLTDSGSHVATRGSSSTIRVEIVKGSGDDQDGEGEILEEPISGKGMVRIDLSRCVACQNCVAACPHEIWFREEGGNSLPKIHDKHVDACSLDEACVRLCPTQAIQIEKSEDLEKYREEEGC